MKVAVYSIAKNEVKHVERWAESARDADEVVLYDTGSTDGTVEAGLDNGVLVHQGRIMPWRFDDARNASLAAVPADIDMCVALDVDEVLQPGWRDALEAAHANGWTRPRYLYVWSWTEPGVPGLQYHGDKVHHRTGYRWRNPVHEVLVPWIQTETQGFVSGFEIHHHPDPLKSRGQYLPLLALSVREDPDDDRNSYYFARELMYAGRSEEAVAEFQRHLSLPRAQWRLERASSMRYLGRLLDSEEWLLKAVEEAPDQRESRVELAEYYYRHGEWQLCLMAAEGALAQTERTTGCYIIEGDAWSWKPHDQAAIALYQLGRYSEAIEHGRRALDMAVPSERDRLAANLAYYVAAG